MPRVLGITALCALLAFLVVGVTPTDPTAVTDAASQRALDAITSETFDPAHPAEVFPADFAAVMGYEPVVVVSRKGNPILVKPTGDCSAFAGDTEYRFAHVCMEHDLAYDVLRYSEAIGRPLPADSRRQADAMFRRELHANCTWSQWSGADLALCHGWAEAFAEAVEINSWRQGYRPPPLQESVARWSLCCLVFAALVVARWTMDRMSEPAAPLSMERAR